MHQINFVIHDVTARLSVLDVFWLHLRHVHPAFCIIHVRAVSWMRSLVVLVHEYIMLMFL